MRATSATSSDSSGAAICLLFELPPGRARRCVDGVGGRESCLATRIVTAKGYSNIYVVDGRESDWQVRCVGAIQSPQHLSLGRALRELREARGISQEELAFRSGLHRNYVGSCERGEINLSFRVMLQLAGGLQISFGEIAQLYEQIEAAGSGTALTS